VPCPSNYPPHPNLKQLKHQAKGLRKAHQAADADSIQRLKAHLPLFSDVFEDEIRNTEISLQDCQHVIAREYGFESWNWLRVFVEVDFGLLNRLSDRDVQVLLCEAGNHEWRVALQATDDDTGNTHPCPEGLVERVLDLMPEALRALMTERMAIPLSVSSNQVQEMRRHILRQADLLAAHGYICWPGGNHSTLSHESIGDVSPFLLDLVRCPVEKMSIDDIAELSGRLTLQARRLYIWSLQAVVEETVDPFLREALQLAIDGTELDALRRLLEERLVRTPPPTDWGKHTDWLL
jgi:hypothetical protein